LDVFQNFFGAAQSIDSCGRNATSVASTFAAWIQTVHSHRFTLRIANNPDW
jgi:hypothetical protein